MRLAGSLTAEYFEYFSPDFTLHPDVSVKIENQNTRQVGLPLSTARADYYYPLHPPSLSPPLSLSLSLSLPLSPSLPPSLSPPFSVY